MGKKTIKHLAIIMDGNGRWAKERGMSRSKGHEKGAAVARRITELAAQKGIKYLTLYTFSTENWARPKREVDFLMKLFARYLDNELPTYQKHDIRFETIGDLSKFSDKLKEKIEFTKNITAKNHGLTQILAVNYGSKDEIRRAFVKLSENNAAITEEAIESALDTAGIPPVDMLIRTGGEKRLSNFLLWQAAYAELFFTDTLWPDFAENEFFAMIDEFENRERRFGKV